MLNDEFTKFIQSKNDDVAATYTFNENKNNIIRNIDRTVANLS